MHSTACCSSPLIKPLQIWSLRFSADGREIVAGATSGSIHVYDLDTRRTILSIPAHEEDVNAVCFADSESVGHLLTDVGSLLTMIVRCDDQLHPRMSSSLAPTILI